LNGDAPIALVDAPQRAIRSTIVIHREMARFADKIKEKAKDIPPIKMRLGIHVELVVLGMQKVLQRRDH